MKKFLLPLFSVILLQFTQAQNYNFSVLNSPYVPLSGSTSINNGTVWTSWSGVVATANIGFTFVANGNLNTTALHFDDNMIPTVVYSNQPNPATAFVYAPIIADTADRGMVSGTSQSNISYKVDGTPGSRIFKLEWNNMGFYDEIESDNISSDFMNVQLWLYEGSNIIEYHYGSSNISNPAESFGGEPGFGCGLYPEFDFNNGIVGNAYAISGNGSAPAFAYTPNYQVYVTTPPASGTVYRFSPTVLATQEVSTNNDVFITPTFVEDSFTIHAKSGVKIKSVSVYDASGKLMIYKEKIQNVSMDQAVKGMYNVVVETEKGKNTVRIMKK